MAVDVKFVQDTLRGDNVTEIRMKFIKRIEENLPAGDEWCASLGGQVCRGAGHTTNTTSHTDWKNERTDTIKMSG